MSESHSTDALLVRLCEMASRLLEQVRGPNAEEDVSISLNIGMLTLTIADRPSSRRHAEASPEVPASPKPPSILSQAILHVLTGRALRINDLVKETGATKNSLYGLRGVRMLMETGQVAVTKELGYFRPDAMPGAVDPLGPLPESLVVPRSASVNDPPRFVYFIHAARSRRIKIGSTKNPEKRLSQLRTSCPEKLRPLGVCRGARTLEGKLHEMFGAHRIRGEWFADCQPIRDYIAQHAQPWPRASEAS